MGAGAFHWLAASAKRSGLEWSKGEFWSERGIPDVVLFKSLALVVWPAWTLLLVSLGAEVVPSRAGLSAPSIAFVGPFQALAACGSGDHRLGLHHDHQAYTRRYALARR